MTILWNTKPKVYRWDCVTMGERCFGCPHYHVMSKGPKVHACPRGIRIRCRRVG